MNLHYKIQLYLLIFLTPFVAKTQNNQEKAERFIVQELTDSAKVFIKKINNKRQQEIYNRINNNSASYNDYNYLLTHTMFFGKLQLSQLVKFLNKRVKYPTTEEKVSLSFVKLKANQIELIANELELKNANKESQRLKKYLSKIKNRKSNDYKLAELYAELHTGLLEMIQLAPKGKNKALQNANRAMKLDDVYLSLKFKDLALSYLISEGDLFGYIEGCEQSLKIERELPQKTPLYETTIAHLVDALIFKTHGASDPEIERLLMELYNSPQYHYQSFSLLAKYIGHLPKNDPSALRFYKLVGTSNVGDFCRKLIADAKGKINDNELSFLYHESTVACYYQEDYGNCFALNNDKTHLIKKIYSSELSQTIADYQTQEVEREKEFKIKQEKAKSQFYLILAIVVGVFLLISIYLIIITVRKSKILAIRNKEKEMLVKEINHRVKNNFQLVNSLLEMQSKEISDKETIKKLNEGQSRIKSMSLIHQKLYQTEFLGLVDFGEYAQQLSELMLSMVNFDKVKINLMSENIQLDIDTAIPLGLILNELFTNSLKYALTNEEGEFVKIEIHKTTDHNYELIYTDSGKGFNDYQPSKGTGMGMKLIRSLVRQLQGVLTGPAAGSSSVKITFKDKKGRKEID